MVKTLLMLCLFSIVARAELFDFSSEGERERRIPAIVEKLKNLNMKEGPQFDETFNQMVKSLEVVVEEEKLYCSGESSDEQGRTLPNERKQLCMRELKKHYVDAMDAIFDLKKKYLSLIHQKQMENMGEVHKKLKSNIEKNF